MTVKREREYERRRYEKWQERQAKARAKKTRQRWIAGSIVAALVCALGAGALVVLNNDDGTPSASASTPAAEPTTAPTANSADVPDPSLAQARTWTGDISLSQGDVGISLDGAAAPQAVANFVTLAGKGFFDKTKCHRLTGATDGLYVLQCGDPTGTGSGGPGYQFEDEINTKKVERGALAMANAGPNTNGSQFFIVTASSCPWLDGLHTVFGQVVGGMDVVDEINTTKTGSQDRPVDEVRIESITVADAA